MSKIKIAEIDELLTRGVDKIYPSRDALEKVLRRGKKLRLYQGFDPSGILLHIGHLVGLMKLRQFQSLGHEVIFLIGDGTGQAGDPSGKTRTREKFLTLTKLKQNAKDYVLQASKIIDFEGKNKARILYNSDWLNKLSLIAILNIAGHFSLQQLEERDLYEERKKKGLAINMREFLYPLLQGYDSVAMNVDLEIGGTDQTFNMLAGRKLVREIQNREKYVLTTPLLSDASGNKIGKTEDNVIAINSKPTELYGLIMNLPDDVIIKCFEYITLVAMNQIKTFDEAIKRGENPMIYKKKLALELVKLLNSKKDALYAQKYFEETIQKQKPSDNIPIACLKEMKNRRLMDVLLEIDSSLTGSRVKRLIKEGAVDLDDKTMYNPTQMLEISEGSVIKIGKHKFVKIKKGG